MKIKLKKILKSSDGFTLIEMILVLFVISVLLILVIPNVVQQKDKIDKQGAEALTTVVETQVELYLLDNDPGIQVTFEKLKEGNYLKQKQVDNAKQKGITIENNQVRLK
ncbi:competence type IV pilus major pilin ComGC [Carnobacterium gallinarum]|uniref:competence type IV pilus major pilin ComGC n=1 Tax=Carnobacterium gallinarum TaxID=2749 RepID=UPI000557E3D1|nr:competence type IV pilus major pilin ComGC [Carnobacterium gallinarum]